MFYICYCKNGFYVIFEKIFFFFVGCLLSENGALVLLLQKNSAIAPKTQMLSIFGPIIAI